MMRYGGTVSCRAEEKKKPLFTVGQVVGLAVGGIGQIIRVGQSRRDGQFAGEYLVKIRTSEGLQSNWLKEFELHNR